MTEAGATCVVVDRGGRALGILTDRDLRTRVVADGLSADAPVAAAMTAPALTVAADRPGGQVLLDMLDRGVRHLPVVSATGARRSASSRTPTSPPPRRGRRFTCARRSRARARPTSSSQAARELRPTIVALHRARDRRRCTSRPCTRWSSTRSRGG